MRRTPARHAESSTFATGTFHLLSRAAACVAQAMSSAGSRSAGSGLGTAPATGLRPASACPGLTAGTATAIGNVVARTRSDRRWFFMQGGYPAPAATRSAIRRMPHCGRLARQRDAGAMMVVAAPSTCPPGQGVAREYSLAGSGCQSPHLAARRCLCHRADRAGKCREACRPGSMPARPADELSRPFVVHAVFRRRLAVRLHRVPSACAGMPGSLARGRKAPYANPVRRDAGDWNRPCPWHWRACPGRCPAVQVASRGPHGSREQGESC